MRISKFYILVTILALCTASLLAGCAKERADDFETHYSLGVAHYKANDFKKAEGEIRAAISVNPKKPKAHNMLGLVLEREGVFEEARRSFQQALAIDKKYEEAKTNLSNMEDTKREYSFYRFVLDFIYLLSSEYSNGNNSFMGGVATTNALKDAEGRIVKYDVNYEIYLAKEYFDKCSRALEETADRFNARAVLEIIDTFSAAIQQRQEAIDLEVQGYALNLTYAGEFEKAAAKVKIADSYYVDAAKKVEGMMKEKPTFFSKKEFTDIACLINYYSQDKTEKAEILK